MEKEIGLNVGNSIVSFLPPKRAKSEALKLLYFILLLLHSSTLIGKDWIQQHKEEKDNMLY